MTEFNHQREHIIKTSIQLFVKNGYLSISMDQLAKEAKVSRGLIIYHFGSLEGLLHEVIRRIGLALSNWYSLAKQQPNAHEKFQFLVIEWIKMLKEDISLWQLYLIFLSHQETENIITPLVIIPFEESFHPFLSDIFRELGHTQPAYAINVFDTFRTGLIHSFSKNKDMISLDHAANFILASLISHSF